MNNLTTGENNLDAGLNAIAQQQLGQGTAITNLGNGLNNLSGIVTNLGNTVTSTGADIGNIDNFLGGLNLVQIQGTWTLSPDGSGGSWNHLFQKAPFKAGTS